MRWELDGKKIASCTLIQMSWGGGSSQWGLVYEWKATRWLDMTVLR